MGAVNKFAVARQSVWDAIDNWPPLDGVFKTKEKFEPPPVTKKERGSALRDVPTSPIDCPYIAIWPRTVPTEWVNNNVQRMDYELIVTIFTNTPTYTPLEQIWLDVIDAVWKSKAPEAPKPYTQMANGTYLPRIGPAVFAPVKIGTRDAGDDNKVRGTMLTGSIIIPLNHQPR